MICAEILPQVTQKEAGVYRAVVADSRGEDESILELVDSGEEPSFLCGTQKSCSLLRLVVSSDLYCISYFPSSMQLSVFYCLCRY